MDTNRDYTATPLDIAGLKDCTLCNRPTHSSMGGNITVGGTPLAPARQQWVCNSCFKDMVCP